MWWREVFNRRSTRARSLGISRVGQSGQTEPSSLALPFPRKRDDNRGKHPTNRISISDRTLGRANPFLLNGDNAVSLSRLFTSASQTGGGLAWLGSLYISVVFERRDLIFSSGEEERGRESIEESVTVQASVRCET